MPVKLGFDSSVLSAFARAKKLDMLGQLTHGHRRVVTRAVLDELDRGCAAYPTLADVRSQSSLEVVAVDSLEGLVAFSHYVRVLGSQARNVGEASILAWGEVGAGVAVVDDNAAVTAAKAKNVAVRRSLGLLCDGLHKKSITIEQARLLVDELASKGGARLPCDGAGFAAWAESNGLLATG
jgi:predicted nucleic acid-binding protein